MGITENHAKWHREELIGTINTMWLNPNRLHGHRHLAMKVLEDPAFFLSPGGSAKTHHGYKYGLFEHTHEVIMTLAALPNRGDLNWPNLLVAAIWHDFGKIWDYEHNPHFGPGEENPVLKRDEPFRNTQHRYNIRHLARSYAEFWQASEGKINDNDRDEIAHIILSHHGLVANGWGSAVDPLTKEAWALHLADMMSVNVIYAAKYKVQPSQKG